jgi:diadenosine tetraphosphatase ApaH/serine/threonine PP2A family protein phosphatase
MTRIAVIADVHGNVCGNVDRVMVHAFDERWTFDPDERTPWRKAGGWIAERMTKQHRDFLASFEATVAVDDVFVCHSSPTSDDETMTSLTPEADVREMLAGVEQRLVVCGHTHVQLDRTVDDVRIVNTGSVGMPFEGPPGAFWLMLGREPELRRTDYDVERTADRSARATTGTPSAQRLSFSSRPTRARWRSSSNARGCNARRRDGHEWVSAARDRPAAAAMAKRGPASSTPVLFVLSTRRAWRRGRRSCHERRCS